jgi:hypothetical protein
MKLEIKIILSIFISTIFYSGCKKSEIEGGMDFKINGIKDITLAKNQ